MASDQKAWNKSYTNDGQWSKIQRCNGLRCRKTFNESFKFEVSMYYQAARLYFTEEFSYRAFGRQWGITPLIA